MVIIKIFFLSGNSNVDDRERFIIESVILPIQEATFGLCVIQFFECLSNNGITFFDVKIEAGYIPNYLSIQRIIKDKLPKEYIIIGRDIEYTGVKYLFNFQWGEVKYRYPADLEIPINELFEGYENDLVIASIIDD